jgi:hypothetical protein
MARLGSSVPRSRGGRGESSGLVREVYTLDRRKPEKKATRTPMASVGTRRRGRARAEARSACGSDRPSLRIGRGQPARRNGDWHTWFNAARAQLPVASDRRAPLAPAAAGHHGARRGPARIRGGHAERPDPAAGADGFAPVARCRNPAPLSRPDVMCRKVSLRVRGTAENKARMRCRLSHTVVANLGNFLVRRQERRPQRPPDVPTAAPWPSSAGSSGGPAGTPRRWRVRLPHPLHASSATRCLPRPCPSLSSNR